MAISSTATQGARPDPATEARRESILAAATRVFLAEGYGAAGMDQIAREAGVAKQTVYSHFGAKAALFEAIIASNADRMLRSLDTDAVVGADPATALTAIARRLLDIVLSPEAIARFRVVVAESGRFPELADIFYRSGPERVTTGLARYLATLHQRRILDIPDPELAAGQFFGMVRGDLFLRRLLRIGETPPPEAIDRAIANAVRCFMAAHRVPSP